MMRWWAAFFIVGMAYPPGAWGAAAGTAAAAAIAGAWIVSGRTASSRAGYGYGIDARPFARFAALAVGAIVLWQTAGLGREAAGEPLPRAAEVGRRDGGEGGGAPAGGRPGRIASLSMSGTRSRFVALLDDGRLSRRGRGFVGALVLGDRRGLGPSLRERYSYLGIAHFLALSGLHLGVVAVPLAKLLSLFLPARRFRDGALLALLALYASLACFPASLVRALALAVAVAAYRFAGLPADLLGSLVLGSFAVAAIDTAAVFEAGFELSFAAVLGIAAIGVPVTRAIGRMTPRGAGGTAIRVLTYPAVITCAVQFAALPLVLSLFGRAPLVSPLVNVVVSLPFTALIYAAAIYTFVPFSPVRFLLAPPIELLCRLLEAVPAAFVRLPQPAIVAGDVNGLLYACGVAAAAIALGRRGRRGAVFAVSAALIAASFCLPVVARRAAGTCAGGGGSKPEEPVQSLDDGYAYLAAGGGVLFLGDRFGRREASRLERLLWRRGVRGVDRCVLVPAAPRADHGLFHLADRLNVREVVCGPYAASRDERRLAALESKGIAVTAVSAGTRIEAAGLVVVVTGPRFPPGRGRAVSAEEAALRFEIVEPAAGRLIDPAVFSPRFPARRNDRGRRAGGTTSLDLGRRPRIPCQPSVGKRRENDSGGRRAHREPSGGLAPARGEGKAWPMQ